MSYTDTILTIDDIKNVKVCHRQDISADDLYYAALQSIAEKQAEAYIT